MSGSGAAAASRARARARPFPASSRWLSSARPSTGDGRKENSIEPRSTPHFGASRSLASPNGTYRLPPAAPRAPRPPQARSPRSIALVPYDPRWPRLFEAERRRIDAVAGTLTASVLHVGSSSVPGLGGRPEIDILIGVRNMRDAPAIVRGVQRLGYREPPGRERYADQWRFLRRPGAVTLEMLIVPDRGELWRHIVAFRDRLRRDPSAARAYYRLKVASRGGATGYWEAKRCYQAAVHP